MLAAPLTVRSIAETWETRRRVAVDVTAKGAAENWREFAEVMNANTRRLIAEFQQFDPEWWQNTAGIFKCLAELQRAPKEALRKAGGALDVDTLMPHIDNVQLWDALHELAFHAATLVSKAKFRVNHVDRTNV